MTSVFTIEEEHNKTVKLIHVNHAYVPNALLIEDYDGQEGIYERIASIYGFKSMDEIKHGTCIRLQWTDDSHTSFFTIVNYRIPEESIGLNWDCFHDAYRQFVCERARNLNK